MPASAAEAHERFVQMATERTRISRAPVGDGLGDDQRRLSGAAAREGGGGVRIGLVDGTGTTIELHSYRFADQKVPFDPDSLTDRLRQVDTDGSALHSDAITLERSAIRADQLLGSSPNPVRQQATVRFAIPEGEASSDVTLRLYDALGRQV